MILDNVFILTPPKGGVSIKKYTQELKVIGIIPIHMCLITIIE